MTKKPLARHIAKRNNEIIRNQRIAEMYAELYKVKRLRPDDCLAQVADHFCLATSTVYYILKRHDLKSPPPPRGNKVKTDD